MQHYPCLNSIPPAKLSGPQKFDQSDLNLKVASGARKKMILAVAA